MFSDCRTVDGVQTVQRPTGSQCVPESHAACEFTSRVLLPYGYYLWILNILQGVGKTLIESRKSQVALLPLLSVCLLVCVCERMRERGRESRGRERTKRER